MQRFLSLACVSLALLCQTGNANNAACWGHGKNDPDREDISCTPLTERFLISMHMAARRDVLRTMNASGRQFSDDTLHFISNYAMGEKGWTGYVNFTFIGDRVTIIYANVDGPPGRPQNMEYIWNANMPGCSDFPDSRNKCAQ